MTHASPGEPSRQPTEPRPPRRRSGVSALRAASAAFTAFIALSSVASEPMLKRSGLSAGTKSSVGLLPPPDAAPLVTQIGPLAPPIDFDRRPVLAQASGTQKDPPADIRPPTNGRPWGENKSYLIPALEIVGFDTLLNAFDRAYYGCCDFDSNGSTIKRNLRRGFGRDNDEFTVNQLGHPYQGSMYHGFARASGLNFWEGFAYAFVGSAFWEIAGETTRPSTNDQINTPVGGALLGEALFRMSNLLLEQWEGPRFWRELGAAAISPPVGFNRLAFGDRFDAVYPSNNAEYYSRIAVGVSATTQDRPGTTTEIKRNEAVLDFSLDYGIPGKDGYVYRRPFDYFTFQASASSGAGFENVMTRGLLVGRDYEWGNNWRGIWGLYGSYDYLSPQIFRMGSSGLSIGTTAEWHISRALSLQGSLLGGIGYTTVSTIHGVNNERDNRYGVAPQATLALRLIAADRASLDFSAREFFVSDVAGGQAGHDNIVRGDASFTWRISGPHAIAVKYQVSQRDARYDTLGDRSQTRGTVGIFYTLLGRDRMGNVSWAH